MYQNINKIYHAAIYVRLSKEDGDISSSAKLESNSISNQKALILDFLKDKKDIEVVSVRVDDGYSGSNFERPAFQAMLEDIRRGIVDCVVVKDLSRFGREYWSYVKKKYKLNVTNFLCSERSLTCYFYCILLDVFKILFLIFIWRQISTMTVNAHGIVKCFDVFKNQFMCMCIIKDFKPVDSFSLQKCMERFYTGVIPWICFL